MRSIVNSPFSYFRKTNDNFVRIDVSKKLFVRGKRKQTGAANKKFNWKLRKSQQSAEAKIKLVKCRKCGGVGHFAKFCLKGLKISCTKVGHSLNMKLF